MCVQVSLNPDLPTPVLLLDPTEAEELLMHPKLLDVVARQASQQQFSPICKHRPEIALARSGARMVFI